MNQQHPDKAEKSAENVVMKQISLQPGVLLLLLFGFWDQSMIQASRISSQSTWERSPGSMSGVPSAKGEELSARNA